MADVSGLTGLHGHVEEDSADRFLHVDQGEIVLACCQNAGQYDDLERLERASFPAYSCTVRSSRKTDYPGHHQRNIEGIVEVPKGGWCWQNTTVRENLELGVPPTRWSYVGNYRKLWRNASPSCTAVSWRHSFRRATAAGDCPRPDGEAENSYFSMSLPSICSTLWQTIFEIVGDGFRRLDDPERDVL